MGLFDKVLRKRAEPAKKETLAPIEKRVKSQTTPPTIQQEKKPESAAVPVKKRTSWLDELADPNSGVHEALAKLECQSASCAATQKSDPVYTVEHQKDAYYIIYKNGKEFFDGEAIATNGKFILAEGFRGDGEALALFTPEKLITIRKFEDGVEGTIVLPSGIAFVFSDNEKVIIMSDSGTSVKNFAYGSAPDESRIIFDSACAFVEDNGEHVILKCFVFSSQSVWTKKIKYEQPEDKVAFSVDPILCFSGDVIEVVTPDGSVSHFSLGGERL